MNDITITLKPEQWNVVLGALGEAPFRVSQPVIAAIQEQASGQVQQQQAQAPAVTPGVNGAHPARDELFPPRPPA